MSRVVRGPDRQLSPWDQAPYFQRIKESFFNFLGNGIQIAVADPSRIALVISNSGAGNAYVSTLPTVSSNTGIVLGVGQVPLMLLHHDVGPLCQQAWYGSMTGATTGLTVIEVLLSKWPGEQ